jgi:Kef-type K+ transport system membrane component KefB
MEFNQYIALIVFSLIVMISHVFDVVSKKLKVPSVLLLMGFGIILQYGSMIFDLPVFSVTNYLKVFGTVGLILIVLESALDLQIKRSNFRIVEKSFGAALGILLVSVGFLSLFFYYWMGADIQSAVINAIPLAVISSAVVISSTAHLAPKKREFLTYESIFSDILGIMLFTLILELDVLAIRPIVSFGVNIIFVTIISVVCSAALIFSLNKIKSQAKFFIIL